MGTKGLDYRERLQYDTNSQGGSKQKHPTFFHFSSSCDIRWFSPVTGKMIIFSRKRDISSTELTSLYVSRTVQVCPSSLTLETEKGVYKFPFSFHVQRPPTLPGGWNTWPQSFLQNVFQHKQKCPRLLIRGWWGQASTCLELRAQPSGTQGNMGKIFWTGCAAE